MLCVRLITDPFDLGAYSEHHLLNQKLVPFLQEQFNVWPRNARLYEGHIAVANDVTPRTEREVQALDDADGIYTVVVYPADPVTAIIVGVIAAVALTAIMYLLMPKIPKADNAQSATNTLGERANKARPNERILDNFGNQIVVLELLAVPYSIFENNNEIEIMYSCVGRGDHDISSIKDGDTPLNLIAGAGAYFYGPGTSPNSGTPSASIGTAIGQPLRDVVKSNDANGQVLRPPNYNQYNGDGNVRFLYPDTIQQNSTDSDDDLTRYFATGDELTVSNSSPDDTPGSVTTNQIARFTYSGTVEFESFNPTGTFAVGKTLSISNAAYAESDGSGGVIYVDLHGDYVITAVDSTSITLDNPGDENPDWNKLDDLTDDQTGYHSSTFSTAGDATGYNLDGTYLVVSVTSGQIVLSNPAAVNSSWNNLANLVSKDDGEHATSYGSASLNTSTDHWVGPYMVDHPLATEVIANFVCLQGLYEVTKKGKQKAYSLTVQIEITPTDVNGVPTGAATYYNTTLSGVKTNKDPLGQTIVATLPQTSRFQWRARRTSPTDLDYDGTIVDEVKIRDVYATTPVTLPDFGDVTTCFSRTVATNSATSVKERKLNCRAIRKVLVRNPDNTLGPALVATNNAASILCHAALDPYIGGRKLAELDVQQLFDTIASVQSYFGIPEVGTFNYSFDQLNTSFEEIATAIATSVFCQAYRQGSKMYLFFEQKTDQAMLLFNHRNKLPKSEKRTLSFGMFNDNDGIELDYVDPDDGTTKTVYVPEDRSAVKPKKLAIDGVHSEDRAYLHAYRAYNKLKWQSVVSEFTTLSEASQLVLGQQVRNADNTAPDIQDGYVVAVDGMILQLSQPTTFAPGATYVIWVQMPEGLISVEVAAGIDEYHVVLQEAPAIAIVVDDGCAVDIGYQIIGSNDVRADVFLVSKKGTYDRKAGTLDMQLINYDNRYYDFDLTYNNLSLTDANGQLVDDNGPLLEQ